MKKDYPEYNRTVREMSTTLGRQLPATMTEFARLHKAALGDGVLSSKMKELIALAIAITVRCDGCIAFHVHDALEAGAAKREILETIGVAILMGGGPSVVYGAEALSALEQFEMTEVS
jgi:AhpD family alkylhydroperoxidase